MRRVAMFIAAVGVCIGVVLVPSRADAQASIVGQAQDSSGAVLPGVTVEVSSPALIEKTRNAVTDGSGRYSITDLRPGTYTVTFTLTGFRKVKREGVELQGTFAAQVNGELAVGSLEETLTVQGASPVVDLQNQKVEVVVSQAILQALPVARNLDAGMALVPGVNAQSNTPGATPGMMYGEVYNNFAGVHGSLPFADQRRFVDGMNVVQMVGYGGSQMSSNPPNDLGLQEMVYDVSAHSAEFSSAGVKADAIPKLGGNTFTGTYRVFGFHHTFQSDNLTPDLAKFIKNPTVNDFNWENNVALGGPIVQNKLWYFGSFKITQFDTFVANQTDPKSGKQLTTGGHPNPSANLRLTSQWSEKNKLRISANHATSHQDRYDITGNTDWDGSLQYKVPLNYYVTARNTTVLSNRLLLEVGQSFANTSWYHLYQDGISPFASETYNIGTGAVTGASYGEQGYNDHLWNTIANVSYVTGSNSLKTGVSFENGGQHTAFHTHNDTEYNLLLPISLGNGLVSNYPVGTYVWNSPGVRYEDMKANLGVFVQDVWTLKRLTLNLGGRYDYLNAGIPVQDAPAGNFVPARHFDAIPCVPCWNDWSVRLGGTYDLFGNSKTAIKAFVGKFVQGQTTGLAEAVNPLSPLNDFRPWTGKGNPVGVDSSGNPTVSFVDANGVIQYDWLGPSRYANFGLASFAPKFDPTAPRPSNWEENVILAHELRRNVSVSAGYFHRQFYNLPVIRNLAINNDTEWTAFTLVGPPDPRLPNGGGELITQYNLNANAFGRAAQNIYTYSKTNQRIYHGLEFTLNGRLPKGGFLLGGITVDRVETNYCDVGAQTDFFGQQATNPNALRFCHEVPPFRALYKLSGGYLLPASILFSGTVQFIPGNPYRALYSYTTLPNGQPLTGGASQTVDLVDPAHQFYPTRKQLDLRAARTFRVGRMRPQAFVEMFNILNYSTILTQVSTFSTVNNQWQNPLVAELPRRFQFGFQLDF